MKQNLDMNIIFLYVHSRRAAYLTVERLISISISLFLKRYVSGHFLAEVRILELAEG